MTARTSTSRNSKKAAGRRPARRPTKARAPARGKKRTGAAPSRKRAGGKPARRADFGAPIQLFFAKQPPHLRPILEELRRLVEAAAPDAVSSLKWGMPFYTLGGEMMCVLTGHRSHVNLVLPGPRGTFKDPEGLLEGEGITGRHLKLRSLDRLPRRAVRGWLRTAARNAREKVQLSG